MESFGVLIECISFQIA